MFSILGTALYYYLGALIVNDPLCCRIDILLVDWSKHDSL
jgi:hypothetical protein